MADTICKWCDREISEPDNEHPYWHDSDKFLAMTCSGTPNRRHEPAEPSTEGTQVIKCSRCQGGGEDGPGVPCSLCGGAGFRPAAVPAPVAQVDAGKYDFAKVRSQHFTEIAEEYEPAVAQTELPPIPDDLKRYIDGHGYGIAEYKGGGWPEDWTRSDLLALIERIASLTQRLQASETREAELKAEIAKMQMDNVIDYKAACEQHAANYEALERSHKALLEMLKDAYNPNPDRPTLRSELESVLAAAEKL